MHYVKAPEYSNVPKFLFAEMMAAIKQNFVLLVQAISTAGATNLQEILSSDDYFIIFIIFDDLTEKFPKQGLREKNF